MNKSFYFVLLIAMLTGCSNPLTGILPGKWTAYNITEEGEKLPIEAAEVAIEIKVDGTYVYHSTLNYKEEGSWRLKDDLLFTKENKESSKEKAVMVISSDPDTLILRMLEKGKERLVYMAK